MASTPRELAYKTLLAAEKDTSHGVDTLLSNVLQSSELAQQEKAWVMELVYGVTRMKLQLDEWISLIFKGRYRKAQHGVKCLLRMGVFQLKYMQTSEHAAIHETVALSRQIKQGQASGLVNAVLRKIQKLDLEALLKQSSDDIQRLSLETSHPRWLLEKWVSRYERGEVISLCQHNNTPPQIWIRRNMQVVGAEALETFLADLNIGYKKSAVLDVFYEIESAATLFATKEFHAGWFSLQDLAAGIVASLLEPESGDTIVDACAAPGGKMAFISELSGGQAKVFACDASISRLSKVRENIERLGLKQIEVCELDAAVEQLPQANKILLDVPCSGTGVLNRRPDARWKRQASDIFSLVNIQSKILQNSWEYLLPGGLLVYATCTLEPEENWGLLDSVLEHLKGARVEAITEEKLKPYIDERGALSTLPWRHSMDGMFAVKIRKTI
ncbi:MAG: 16S rRNA (cytosine(967)-C(5))-methyltransferase RsmB [Candidatus Marinimicrobia bacterium]|nr:16S rRNA (cytosine(967)-C(5))-methyltransferase RsmB [Candidatus Neomarinimicrobiota bacterium]